MVLRKNNALQRRNIIATGGGPSDTNESKLQFEVTGPLQELANAVGVSITGLIGYGSDRQELETSNQQGIDNTIDECLPNLLETLENDKLAPTSPNFPLTQTVAEPVRNDKNISK